MFWNKEKPKSTLGRLLQDELYEKLYKHPDGCSNVKEIRMKRRHYYTLLDYYRYIPPTGHQPKLDGFPVVFTD